MKRLRIVIDFVVMASLVLCVVYAGDFARDPSAGYSVFEPIGPALPNSSQTWQTVAAFRAPPPSFDLAGFRIERCMGFDNGFREGRLYVVPYWFIAVLYAIVPSLWLWVILRRARRHKRDRLGLCATCGYDLRASAGRCPECGVVPKKAK